MRGKIICRKAWSGLYTIYGDLWQIKCKILQLELKVKTNHWKQVMMLFIDILLIRADIPTESLVLLVHRTNTAQQSFVLLQAPTALTWKTTTTPLLLGEGSHRWEYVPILCQHPNSLRSEFVPMLREYTKHFQASPTTATRRRTRSLQKWFRHFTLKIYARHQLYPTSVPAPTLAYTYF